VGQQSRTPHDPEALAKVVIADEPGFDWVWANEHHFLEEYSHSSAPEVFLAAARTQQIHLGHAAGLSRRGITRPRGSPNGSPRSI
jgi:alkanesulfonate monooxygenase SsuD/methylene tetrahydromethanopterin reductase-like flavin-dependent oxidoreductase (luciferase family)